MEPRHNAEATLSGLVIELCAKVALKISRLRRLRETVRGAVASARGVVTVTWKDIELSMTSTGRPAEQSIAKVLYKTVVMADHHGLAGLLLML
ncbi:MAG: hypothetical protein ACRDX8_02205, partial [Acidimicrobiales bacterium]